MNQSNSHKKIATKLSLKRKTSKILKFDYFKPSKSKSFDKFLGFSEKLTPYFKNFNVNLKKKLLFKICKKLFVKC